MSSSQEKCLDPAYQTFHALQSEVAHLRAAIALLEWDQQTYMPRGGAEDRAALVSTLKRLHHERLTSDDFGEALQAARQSVSGMDAHSDEVRLVAVAERDFDKKKKVPSEWVASFARATALAFSAWQQAKAASDFAQFEPHLRTVIEHSREYASFFQPYHHVYDPLLDDYEPGMSTAKVEAAFGELKEAQVAIIQAIQEQPQVDDHLLHQAFDEAKQWEFGLQVIRAFGYDMEHGRQDKSAHPFSSSFGIGDVRITTRLYPDFLSPGLFSSLHEAGHALYDQGFRPDFNHSLLGEGSSLGIHESQSRLWENLVGRSRAFWTCFFPRLQALFPAQLGEASLDDFYRAINKVQPSLIRVDADEATYNLHIMVRFELEKALLEGDLPVGELRTAWNDAYTKTLGITPTDDAQGVLQDVHWAIGYVGYFPTYTMGNMIACIWWEKIVEEFPDIEDSITQGDFSRLLGWLREHIHQHGRKYEPLELLHRITDGGLSPGPYVRYLQAKFSEIYELFWD